MRRLLLLPLALLALPVVAQNVGINASGAAPDASALLDIDASASGNKGGLLIPRLTTAERDGITTPATSLLIFNGTTGQFEYFDGAVWRPLLSNASGWQITGNAGTVAANFIGTTDAQALRFRVANQPSGHLGTVGSQLVSYGLRSGFANTGTGNTFIGTSTGIANTTGGSNTFLGNNAGAANATSSNNTYLGTSAGAANVTGAQNVYIGRLAGGNGVSGSDNILIGNAAGLTNTANNNVMIGSFAGNGASTGGGNTFLGTQAGQATSTGGQNTFIGTGAGGTNTIGIQNTLIGNGASVNANNLVNATAIGRASRVDASDALVLGSVTGINAATSTSRVGIGTTDPLERLHVVGSIRMVDGNQAAGLVMVSDANGTASWASASGGGTLDNAYDFGGAGLGRSITADAGALLITGTDGLVSTGTSGSGATAPSGAGSRMVWNPRKEAFRAGGVSGTQWNDASIGLQSVAFGNNTVASGAQSAAFGTTNTASGAQASVFGNSNSATGAQAAAFGTFSTASSTQSMVFGNVSTASGPQSLAGGFSSTASGNQSVALGNIAVASGVRSISMGFFTTASGANSVAFGQNNTASSYGETVMGIGATTYTPASTNFFLPAHVTDRLLVVGNAIDANSNGFVDAAERSDALVILKNGNSGIGVSAPSERLEVAGRSLFHSGFSPDNAALLYRSNTDYMFLGPRSGSSANGAAIALYGSTNATGGNANGMDVNVPGGSVRLNHTNGSFVFRSNSTSGYSATMELNDIGFQIGHNSTGRDIHFVNGNGERMRITAAGNNLTAGGSWGVLSDRRVKSDIRTMDYGLREVMAMRPVRYFHHDTKGFDHIPGELSAEGKTDIGFIAQDLYAVVPEVVLKPADENASLWAVTYERLVPVLVKAVQEQQQQIEALRKEIEALRTR